MSITFPCYFRVLDSFKPEKKDQMPLKKGEFVRVLRADDTDDNYFGEIHGKKSGFFPNYYVEVVAEEDVPKKDRALFKKLDQAKEAQLAKEREKEARRDKSPVPRKDRTSIVFGGSGSVSPRATASSPRGGGEETSSPRGLKPGALRKQSEPRMRASGRRKSGEIPRAAVQEVQIEVNSVVLPEKQRLQNPAERKMSKQPRRLSRVNPQHVKRLYEGPTFGVPLAHQMYIGYEEFVIPPILTKSVQFLKQHLDTEGLFRVSGSQDEIAVWKDEFNAGRPVEFGAGTSVHGVAGLLKAWLRELPEPLLTYGMFAEWMDIANAVPKIAAKKSLKSIADKMQNLPDINRAVLRELFLFLRLLVDHSQKNLMTAENVGVVIGPNILCKENQDALTSATVMPAAVQLAAFMAKNAPEIFSD